MKCSQNHCVSIDSNGIQNFCYKHPNDEYLLHLFHPLSFSCAPFKPNFRPWSNDRDKELPHWYLRSIESMRSIHVKNAAQTHQKHWHNKTMSVEKMYVLFECARSMPDLSRSPLCLMLITIQLPLPRRARFTVGSLLTQAGRGTLAARTILSHPRRPSKCVHPCRRRLFRFSFVSTRPVPSFGCAKKASLMMVMLVRGWSQLCIAYRLR